MRHNAYYSSPFCIVLLLLFFASFPKGYFAQSFDGASWTGWVNINQQTCLKRAKEAFRLGKISLRGNTNWYIDGRTSNPQFFVGIKCVADDNSNRLINARASRVLVDVSLYGNRNNLGRMRNLRPCLREYVRTGASQCWRKTAQEKLPPDIPFKQLPPPAPGEFYIKTRKLIYSQDEKIVATFGNYTPKSTNSWIALVPADYPDDKYDRTWWFYTKSKRFGTHTFPKKPPGIYELRYFPNTSSRTVMARYRFKVE